jgi:hypothetical protein
MIILPFSSPLKSLKNRFPKIMFKNYERALTATSENWFQKTEPK